MNKSVFLFFLADNLAEIMSKMHYYFYNKIPKSIATGSGGRDARAPWTTFPSLSPGTSI